MEKNYHSRQHLLKLSDPLYWKHVAKTISDKDYKQDAEKVGLPVHLVADPKWKPMIKMFIEDLEYRKNLTETVQESIVYGKGKNKVAKYADDLQNLRSDVSSTQLKDIGAKLTELEEDINAFKIIEKWASEK